LASDKVEFGNFDAEEEKSTNGPNRKGKISRCSGHILTSARSWHLTNLTNHSGSPDSFSSS